MFIIEILIIRNFNSLLWKRKNFVLSFLNFSSSLSSFPYLQQMITFAFIFVTFIFLHFIFHISKPARAHQWSKFYHKEDISCLRYEIRKGGRRCRQSGGAGAFRVRTLWSTSTFTFVNIIIVSQPSNNLILVASPFKPQLLMLRFILINIWHSLCFGLYVNILFLYD